MPLWIIKLLPYGAAVAALLFAVWYLDHKGYERAKQQDTAIQARLNLQEIKRDLKLNGEVEGVQRTLTTGMNELGTHLGSRIDSIESVNKTIIQPTITKEIAGDPHLTSADCALPDGLWGSVNAARRLSAITDPSTLRPTGSQGVSAAKPAQ